jgi:hypothetical protein
MTTTTMTLPSGTKFRSQSSRRFVLVQEFVPGKPVTLYRTDVLDRAVKALRKHSGATVVDTVGRKARIEVRIPTRPGRYRVEAHWESV